MNAAVKEGSALPGAFSVCRQLGTEFGGEYLRRLEACDAGTGEHFASYFGALLEAKLRGQLPRWVAEDIRQETLARVLQRVRSGNPLSQPEKLGAFVLAVCRNVMREHARHTARYNCESPAEPADPRPSQEEPLVSEERKRIVEEILWKMSCRDRQILWLIFFEGRGRGEVSRQFGVSEEYLRVVLHRAMGRVRISVEHREKLAAAIAPYSARASRKGLAPAAC